MKLQTENIYQVIDNATPPRSLRPCSTKTPTRLSWARCADSTARRWRLFPLQPDPHRLFLHLVQNKRLVMSWTTRLPAGTTRPHMRLSRSETGGTRLILNHLGVPAGDGWVTESWSKSYWAPLAPTSRRRPFRPDQAMGQRGSGPSPNCPGSPFSAAN